MVRRKTLSHQFEELASLARFIDASNNAEETYALLTRGVCEHSNWDLSGIQVLDLEAGVTIPIYRYDPFNTNAKGQMPLWDASESPIGLVLGKGDPVVLEDASAQDDYPGFRDDAIERGYSTTVIIPLGVKDTNGRPMVYSVASREPYALQEGDVSFLICVAELSTIAIRKMRKLEKERASAKRMRDILERMSSSLSTTLDQEAAGSLAVGLSTLFPAGWMAVDLTSGRGLFDTNAPPPIPLNKAQRLPNDLITAALNARELEPEAQTRFMYDGQWITAEINPLLIDGTHVGALFFFRGEPLTQHERIAAQAGKLALSSFILRGFIEFKSRRVSARRLIERLVRGDWRDRQDVLNEADRLEIDLNQPCRLIVGLLSENEKISDSSHSFIQRSAQSLFGATISCVLEGRLVMLSSGTAKLDVEEKQRQFFARIEPFTSKGMLFVASDPVERLSRLPQSFSTCLNALEVARSMGANGWVNHANIGVFPSLMASADMQRMDAFLNETLKSALGRNDVKGQRALQTLEAFLRTGRRYQETADALGIHVSTLRYRLDQLADQVGIDFTNSDQCFELELALRLKGMRNSYDS